MVVRQWRFLDEVVLVNVGLMSKEDLVTIPPFTQRFISLQVLVYTGMSAAKPADSNDRR